MPNDTEEEKPTKPKSKAKAKTKKKGGRTTEKKQKAKEITGDGLADQTLTPTAAGAWKKVDEQPADEVGFIAELPSGNVIRMTRSLDMPILLKTGQIPNPLAGLVQKMIDTRSTTIPMDSTDPTSLMQLLDLLNETAAKVVLSPKFSCPERRGKKETGEQYQERLEGWEPDPGTLSIWDMTMEDKFFVFAVAQGAAADLARFRDEQERSLADLQASEGVRDAALGVGGPGSEGSG